MEAEDGKDKLAINFTRPISEKEAEKISSDFLNVPMADVLVELFTEVGDSRTFRFRKMPYKCTIYAGAERGDAKGSLTLEKVSGKFKWVTLRIYSGPLEQIPEPGSINADCLEMVSVSAGPTKTGIWKPGKGNQITYAILVHQRGTISLPTQSGKWFFTVLYRLAQLANEFHLNLSGQPKFWENEGRFEERGQPDNLPDVE